MQYVSTVVTDIDNTLYDWVRIWHRPFVAMVDKVEAISELDRAVILADCQAVFQAHGTTEYAFVLGELKCLRKKHGKADFLPLYQSAIDAYREERRRVLELYDDVDESLQVMKDRGCLIVAYTESKAFYTNYRLRALGLDRLIDAVFSPPDDDVPYDVQIAALRGKVAEEYTLRRTKSYFTPPGERKPNPRLLEHLIEKVGADPRQAIYVGDSLMKDVAMAKSVAVTDVWAKYGYSVEGRAEYDLLRQVTHWSPDEVSRERVISAEGVAPTYTLESGFSELLSLFEFVPHHTYDSKETKVYLDAWQKTIGVQQHFNELGMKLRGLAVAILTTFLGVAGLAAKEGLYAELAGRKVPVGGIVLFAGAGVWYLFGMMDREWYHRLLGGGVKHGHFIENASGRPELALTNTISNASPSTIMGRTFRSVDKLNWFYRLGAVLLVACGLVMLTVGRPEAAVDVANEAKSMVEESQKKHDSDGNTTAAASSVVDPTSTKSGKSTPDQSANGVESPALPQSEN